MMPALRTMEHFIQQRLTVGRCRKLSIFKTNEGRWQAQVENADRSHTVEVADDPADALWNCLVPHTMRRVVTVSGRTLGVDEDAPSRVFLGGGGELHSADLDDLLGDGPTTVPDASGDLEDLLG